MKPSIKSYRRWVRMGWKGRVKHIIGESGASRWQRAVARWLKADTRQQSREQP